MKYLLDTCTVSDVIRGLPGVLTQFKTVPPSELALSTITQMELAYGLALAAATARRIGPAVWHIVASVSLLPFDEHDADAAAQIRAALKRQGCPIGPYDLLIAGCALARGLILVTSNTREFGRVSGLQIENWR
jgi:tRNA(fMet)-specific endonuclease VapC